MPDSMPPLSLPVPGSVWRNNKHGSDYRIRHIALDATNGRENDFVVIYHREPSDIILFTRESREFLAKFTKVANKE